MGILKIEFALLMNKNEPDTPRYKKIINKFGSLSFFYSLLRQNCLKYTCIHKPSLGSWGHKKIGPARFSRFDV